MNPAALLAAAGMRARMETLEVISNNIANSSAHGYKADHEFYRLFNTARARPDARTDGVGGMPYIEGSRIDFGQGPLQTTGAPLDLALAGPGFFVVQGPAGPLYARNGAFHTDAQGVVRTADGLAVLAEDGAPLTLPRDGTVEIDENGLIEVDSRNIARLAVVEFEAPGRLRKLGRGLFEAPPGLEPEPAASGVVRQGALETSNVNVPESAVRLIAASRHFELLRRVATLVGDEMEGRAIETLGRVR